jgi:hypothetical protein
VDLDLLRLLQERERRLEQRAQVAQVAANPAVELAAALRRWLYPKQAAFFRSPATRRATKKTRRSGATAGGCRELIARSLETPGHRATYITGTLKDARKRAWANDTKSGFVDVIRRNGTRLERRGSMETWVLAGITATINKAEMVIDFSNGSQIDLFGADKEGMADRLRGIAKAVFWIDEAQDLTDLEGLYKDVIVAAMQDFGGECWLTGTPGKDCVGMFYAVTTDDEEPLTGWEVHRIASVDNPFFGRVVWERGQWFVEDNLYDQPGKDKTTHAWTDLEQRGEIAAEAHRWGPFDDEREAEEIALKVRWERSAGAAIRENGWKPEDPSLLREYYARWVKGDARYVYPVHSVPQHQLFFAPQRLRDNPFVGSDPRFDGHPPWYDHVAAVRDLPRLGRDRRPHKWLYSLWFDFGFWPDPFAAVLWAFTPTLNDVYEMFSWKQTKVHADDQARYIKLLWDVEPAIVSFGGDAAGKQADFAEWSRRLNLPLEEANKQGKNTLEELLAGDIRRGLVHLREGSPLYTEMRHLVYLPTAPGKPRQVHKHRAVNGVVHGDHCCDAGRYGFAALTHYLSQLGTERPPPGTRQAYEQEAERLERDLDQREARREAALEAADELAEEYGRSEYQWE